MAEGTGNRAEEAVRALAAASGALRLYPATSDLPAQAIARAVHVLATLTSSGSIRLAVEPKAFKVGDEIIGENNPQISGLAEALYAHQVGQLIAAPGVSVGEVTSFLVCVSEDAASIRERGGIRSALVAAGVSHLAVIELTLRTTADSDLVSIDVVSAPLETVGTAVVRAAADWVRSGAAGDGKDLVTQAIDGLESATRELATARILDALAQLDERTRAAVLAAALRPDSAGVEMVGLLTVVARMSPAALARLLKLAAGRTGADPMALIPQLPLSAAEGRALGLILRPNPRSEADSGVPSGIDARAIARDAVDEDEEAESRLRAQVASAPAAMAGTALGTAVALGRRHLDAASIDAVGVALGPALAAGAFASVSGALGLLAKAAQDPALDHAAISARHAMSDPGVLASAAARVTDRGEAELAIPVFGQSGPAGTDALLGAREVATRARADALDIVLLSDVEKLLPVVGRRLRAADPVEAASLIDLVGRVPDKRAVSVLAQALDHPSSDVRTAAIGALAALGTPEAARTLASALYSPDETTARDALRAIATARLAAAVPDIVAQLEARPRRSWEYRREVVDCLKELRAREALPALSREARRAFVFTAKRRAFRQAARDALDAIRSEPDRE